MFRRLRRQLPLRRSSISCYKPERSREARWLFMRRELLEEICSYKLNKAAALSHWMVDCREARAMHLEDCFMSSGTRDCPQLCVACCAESCSLSSTTFAMYSIEESEVPYSTVPDCNNATHIQMSGAKRSLAKKPLCAASCNVACKMLHCNRSD